MLFFVPFDSLKRKKEDFSEANLLTLNFAKIVKVSSGTSCWSVPHPPGPLDIAPLSIDFSSNYCFSLTNEKTINCSMWDELWNL